MKLRVKRFNLSAGKPIAFISSYDAEKLDIHPGERIALIKGSLREIAIVDIVTGFISKGQIALSHELAQKLNAESGSIIETSFYMTPASGKVLMSKLKCAPYTKDDLVKIINDVVSNNLTDAEIAYFISGVNYCGMSQKETKFLIEAIVESGRRIEWKYDKVADKHSIGGIPGNRTTPIVVSICASAGIIMPKTSSRAITSAAGTADAVESIAKVDFSIEEIKKIVSKTNACLVWGGALGLAPADDLLIRVEKMLSLDPEPQLLASILSKKLAVGSTHVLIDIPFGNGAKVSKKTAEGLKRKFISLGKSLGLKMRVVFTDGSEPIGNGIGPALEIKDVIRVLKRENSPKDLENKSVFLAGEIIEMMGKAKPGFGKKLAEDILYSGKAFKKFEEIIAAQGGSIRNIPEAKYKKDVLAKKSGRIFEIRNHDINYLGRILGCPEDKAAGLYLHAHEHDKISKGSLLMTLYSQSKFKLKEAFEFASTSKIITIK